MRHFMMLALILCIGQRIFINVNTFIIQKYNSWQRNLMEAEQNYKKEYDQTLLVYSKKKSENTNLNKTIASTQTIINSLLAALTQPSFLQMFIHPQHPHEDTTEIDQLTQQLRQLQRNIQQNESHIESEGKKFNQLIGQLRTNNDNHERSHDLPFDVTELNIVKNQIAQTQSSIKQQSGSVQTARQHAKQQEQKIILFEAEVVRLQSVENINEQNVDANTVFEQELKKLQQQHDSIEKDIKKSQQQRNDQRKRVQQSLKNDKNVLSKLQKEKNEIISKKNNLQKRLSSNQNQKLNQLQSDIKKLQSQNAQLQREAENIAQSLETKKAEKAAHHQQIKKYKQKKERNYKLQIVQAQKTYENLTKQMEREKQKLSGVVKLSKSYVSQENLQILQKELSRHQIISNKFNLEAEEAKKNKFLRQNQILKSRIQYLKIASHELEQTTQATVKTLKKQGDELVKEKLAQQKVLNQTTNKLNQYMKEYPDHQKKKEIQKQEEKKKRQEDKQKLRQAQRLQKEAKDQQQRQKAKDNDLPLLSNNQGALWPQPQIDSLSPRDQTSIFNNKQFQLVCGVVALLLILMLVFG